MADENKTERVQLLMTPSEVKAIDDWSFENRIRGRAEAMRRLCQIGLGFEENLRSVLMGFDRIGAKLFPMADALTKGSKENDTASMDSFYEQLAVIVEDLFYYRESLAELGHTIGTLKVVDWSIDPNFDDALRAVRRVRAQRRDEGTITNSSSS